MTRPVAGILVVLVAFVTTVAAQTPEARLDPKVAKELDQKNKDLEAAKAKVQAANLTLQDSYARWSAAVANCKSSTDRAVLADLVRVYGEALQNATAAGIDVKPGGKTSKAFEREAEKARRKLEHPLLVALAPTVDASVAKAFEENLSQINRVDSDALGEAIYRRLFDPEREFWQIWNEDVATSSPDVKIYAEAVKAMEKLEREIAVLLDPRLAFVFQAPEGMSKIPAGSYVVDAVLGSRRAKKKTARVKAFYIDIHEVTHGQYYSNFWSKIDPLDKTKQQARLPRNQDKKFLWIQDPETGSYRPPEELLNHPVTGIDAESALAYALSQGKRLPTESEWVAAAAMTPKGGESVFPWGEKYIESRCNDKLANLGKTVPVDSYPEGRSAFGVFNMAGNVREWVATTEKTDRDFLDKIPDGENIVVRGGSYLSAADDVSLRWRWALPAFYSYEVDLGFRCAKDAE